MVSLLDVLVARRRIEPYLSPTALYRYRTLDALVGTEVWVKHENHQPVGAFKVRGGVNLVSQLSDQEREAGVVAASTGNHAQSVAYAARLFGVRAVIVMPVGANPGKTEATRALGAEVILHGSDYDEAREHCEAVARDRGMRYIHSGNEPLLIAGVATATLEILEARPEVEVLLVPIGGGSGAAGACVVAAGLDLGLEVIGVQAEAAPAAYRSWALRRLVEDSMGTEAEGLATRTAFELPQQILWEHLTDFALVSEAALLEATRLMIEHTHSLVEPAGAAPLAAALQLRDRLAGRCVGLMCTGGNISTEQLRKVLG